MKKLTRLSLLQETKSLATPLRKNPQSLIGQKEKERENKNMKNRVSALFVGFIYMIYLFFTLVQRYIQRRYFLRNIPIISLTDYKKKIEIYTKYLERKILTQSVANIGKLQENTAAMCNILPSAWSDPGKRYERIWICLTGEVETFSSPIQM